MTNPVQQDVADLALRRRASAFPQLDLPVEATVALVADARPHSVAVAPDDATVYVTQFGAGGVAVVDVATLTVTSTITGIASPYGVAMTGATGLNVVQPDAETLVFVDLDQPGTPGGSGISHAPYGIAAAHGVVYLSLALEDAILITDRFGKGMNERIKDVEFPVGLAVDDQTHRLYVGNYFSGTVTVVDLGTRSVAATFSVPANPYGLALSPDGRRLFLAHFPDDLVSVVDTASGAVEGTAVVPGAPRGLATSHDGRRLYVTSFFGAALAVVDVSALG